METKINIFSVKKGIAKKLSKILDGIDNKEFTVRADMVEGAVQFVIVEGNGKEAQFEYKSPKWLNEYMEEKIEEAKTNQFDMVLAYSAIDGSRMRYVIPEPIKNRLYEALEESEETKKLPEGFELTEETKLLDLKKRIKVSKYNSIMLNSTERDTLAKLITETLCD